MRRQVTIEFPDGVPDALFAHVVAAVSAVTRAIAGAADPPVRVLIDGDVNRRDRAEPRSIPPLPGHSRNAQPGFTVVVRGYDRAQVDDWVGRVRAGGPTNEQPRFDVVLRGYHRGEVDSWVRQVADAV